MKKKPSMLQAGDYSATSTYLKAVAATNSTDGDTIMKWLKANPVNDFFAKDGKIRADGLMVHDMFLMQVKTPSESKARGITTSWWRACPATRSIPRPRNPPAG